MSIIAKHLKNARLIDTPLGNLTMEHVYLLEQEYRTTGTIKAESLIPINLREEQRTIKNYTYKKRGDTSLADFEMWKRDINYLASELSNFGSMRSNTSRPNNKNYYAIETRKNISQDQISYAIETASKITKCLSSATIKLDQKKKEYKVGHGHWRCKNHACPYCNYKKLRKRQKNFEEGLNSNKIELDYKYSTLITISFKDKATSTEEIIEQLKLLNKSMSQILGYAHIRKVVAGSARSIEVIENKNPKDPSEFGRSHVHLHSLVLFKKFRNGLTLKKLKRYLKDKTNKSIEVHFDELPLREKLASKENLIKGFNYLNKTFGLKFKDHFSDHHIFKRFTTSSITSQSALFYVNMLPAVKGQRMFNTTGIIKKIISEGKRNAPSHRSYSNFGGNYSSNHTHLKWTPKAIEYKTNKGIKHCDLGEYHVDDFDIKYFIDSLHYLGITHHPKAVKILTGDTTKTTESSKTTINSSPGTSPPKEHEIDKNDLLISGDQIPLFTDEPE